MAHIYEKKSLKMTSLHIVYDRGGLYDKEGEYGTSHLMEHLICETFKDEYQNLSRLNIEWNAVTTTERVMVYFTGMDKYFTPEIKQRLVKKLLGGIDKCVNEERFKAERNVVLQEYMDSFNDPESWNNILRQRFNYYQVIGKRSDIENFTYKDMLSHYKKYYTKPSKIVEIGPTKSDFSFVKFAEKPVSEPMKLKFGNYKDVELEEIPKGTKIVVRYGSKKMIKKSDVPALIMAYNILVGGLDAPMMKRIREEKQLTYGVHGGLTFMLNDTWATFSATTDLQNADKMKAEFQYFFNDISKHIKKDRFENEINAYGIAAETKKIFRYKNIGDILRKGLPMMGNAYKKLTLDKVKEVAAKYLNPQNMVDLSDKYESPSENKPVANKPAKKVEKKSKKKETK
ncbi:MAG: insulinase family protein [Methanobrevibacter sp.]|nr:insulinase family protein [Methanobrevibacter sp.]